VRSVKSREHEKGGAEYSRIECQPKIGVSVIVLIALNTKEDKAQKHGIAQPVNELLAIALINPMVRNSYGNARCQQQSRIDEWQLTPVNEILCARKTTWIRRIKHRPVRLVFRPKHV